MKTLREILTRRQFRYAQLISEGYTNKEIADQLIVTESAAKQYITRIYERVGCSCSARSMVPRVELAVRFALESYQEQLNELPGKPQTADAGAVTGYSNGPIFTPHEAVAA